MSSSELVRKRQQEMLDNGTLPMCLGCLTKHVKLDSYCRPRDYCSRECMVEHRRSDNIDIVKFRKVLRDYKVTHKMTWPRLAVKAGLSEKHLESIMYSRAKKTVEREFATSVLRRLADMPTEPSTHQRRQVLNERVRVNGYKNEQGLLAYDKTVTGKRYTVDHG